MNLDDKNKIHELLTQKLESADSNNQAAAQMMISPGTLSQMVNKKWDSIGDNMWRRAANWCGFSATDWPILTTKTYNAIQALCADAKRNHRTLAVIGYTGAGKTEALKKYINKKDARNAYYVLIEKGMSVKELLNKVMRAIGKDVEGSISQRMAFIFDFLNNKVENPLLIFDSMHKGNDALYEILQQFTESLERRCGIVLCGTERLKNYILKMAAKGKSCFPELKRRIGYWQPVYQVQKGTIDKICSIYSITEEDAIDYVQRICSDMGTLRELMDNYSIADKEGMTQLQVLISLNVGDMDSIAA